MYIYIYHMYIYICLYIHFSFKSHHRIIEGTILVQLR